MNRLGARSTLWIPSAPRSDAEVLLQAKGEQLPARTRIREPRSAARCARRYPTAKGRGAVQGLFREAARALRRSIASKGTAPGGSRADPLRTRLVMIYCGFAGACPSDAIVDGAHRVATETRLRGL